ncbi:MAG: anti-sigma factor [Chitinophagales bacterium]
MNSNVLRVVTLVMLSISLIANAFFVMELGGTDERIAALKEEEDVFAQQYKVLQRNYEVAKENFEVLRQENTKKILLQSISPADTAKAIIYWNPNEHTVYIDADGLPIPPPDKQYQVWLLQKEQYIDLGVFNYQTDVANFFRMKNAIEADGFVVSVEKIRGDKQPTKIIVSNTHL